MTRLVVSIGEPDGQYQQSIMAHLVFSDDERFLLETEEIHTEDNEQDLDLIESFCARWEMKSDENSGWWGIPIVFTDSVEDLRSELLIEIEFDKVEEEKTMKRCEN